MALAALLMLFALCGACDLALEVLFLRKLGLLLGADGGSVGVVTALFMSGLGLGYFVAGRVAAKLSRPLLVLGATEIAVGCCALVALQGLSWASEPLLALHRSFVGQISPLLPTLVFGAVCILPVTALMGASLPLGCAVLGSKNLGSMVGLLYGANLAGAVVGPVIAGYVLLETFGTRGSLFYVACTCVAVGGVASVGGLSLGRIDPPSPTRSGRTAGPGPRLRWRVLALAMLIGAVSMAFQVVWIRALTPFLGATIHAFALALAVHLAGLGAGSLASARWLRRRPDHATTTRALGCVMVGLALGLTSACVVLRLWLWVEDPVADPRMLQNVIRMGGGAALSLVVFTVGGATLCSGAILPLIAHQVRRREGVRNVGSLYGANSAGAAVGALFAMFVMLPNTGVWGSITLMGLVILAAGVFVGRFANTGSLPRRGAALGLPAAALAALAAAGRGEPMERFVTHYTDGRMVFYQEEAMGSATVVADGIGCEDTVHLYTEGQQIAFAKGNPEFAVLAHEYYPGTPSRAMVTGLGCGGTCEGMAGEGAGQVDCVELLQGVIDAQPLFRTFRGGGPRPSNVNYIHMDARAHLLRTDTVYDIIFTDGRSPEIVGGYEFLTREFIGICAARLAPDGVLGMLLSWPFEDEATDTLMRTLFERFEWVMVTPGFPVLLAGRGDDIPPNRHGELILRSEWENGPGSDGTTVFTDDDPALMYKSLHQLQRARRLLPGTP